MNVAVDCLGVQLARTAGHIDRRAHRVQIQATVNALDVDVGRGCFHPETYARWNPDLEVGRLWIVLVGRLDEHLGAGVATTGVELIPWCERATNENGVLVPAVDDDAPHHVHDAECAFHPERNSALDLLLRSQRRRDQQRSRQNGREAIKCHA